MSDMNRTCLVTSFFLPDDTRFSFDKELIWDKLYVELRQHSTDLCLLSTTKYPIKYSYRNYIIPYNVSHYPNIRLPNQFTYPTSFKDKLCVWEKIDRIDDKKIDSCAHYLSLLLDEIQPGVVLCWNIAHPASLILKIESLKRHIPVMGIEKGFFPETIMLDIFENSYFSDINLHHVINTQINKTEIDDALIQSLKSYYLGGRTYKRPITTQYAVIYAGAYAANILPKTVTTNRASSKYVSDIETMVDAICESDTNLTYVLSIHPIDYDDLYPKIKVLKAKHKNLILSSEIPDTDMYSIFRFSTYGLFIGCGTTQQEYLLFDKPMILLSNTSLSHKNIAYEYDGANLEEMVSLARKGVVSGEQKQARYKYLTFLFQSYLFGSDTCPATLKIQHLAEHVSKML